MVTINTLHIDPPLLNSSCAWASEETQLRDLFDCEFTGAITTRTATLTGFKENSAVHTVCLYLFFKKRSLPYTFANHRCRLHFLERLFRLSTLMGILHTLYPGTLHG